jgi:hypothetical protein
VGSQSGCWVRMAELTPSLTPSLYLTRAKPTNREQQPDVAVMEWVTGYHAQSVLITGLDGRSEPLCGFG